VHVYWDPAADSGAAPARPALAQHVQLGPALATLRDSTLPNLDELALSVHTFGLHRAPAEILAELLTLPVVGRLRRLVLINIKPDGPAWGHDMARALLQAESLRQIPRVELRLADFDADTGSSLGQRARARPNWYLG
jgi:hypothetical protein